VSLAEIAIEKRSVTYFAVLLLFVGGIGSFFSLGQLEDPEYTVKSASITTTYPGASPEEVELEVTDRIEKAVQELTQLKEIYSTSRAGLSIIKVDIQQEYWSDRLPQVWDELRKKIRDIEHTLPPGAGKPQVGDDFAFVYGFVLAVTGDGFSYAQLEDYAEMLKKELSLVGGVSRVELWGVQPRVIYLDVSEKQLSELGLTGEDIQATLVGQNLVVDAGSVDVQSQRLRVAPTGEFRRPEDIGDLTVRPSLRDVMVNLAVAPAPATSELIRIRDIGTVRRGYQEPPPTLMRLNGRPAIGISLANVAGGNIVETGRNIDARLAALETELPVGIEVTHIAWQSDEVSAAISSFLISLIEAVAIVLVVLAVPMGWRMGFVIGSSLILTILGTFMLMAVLGIDLQRMSLGALVIALGMMVDNSIVVADGIAVRLQRGMERKQAAIESASSAAWPLLGATVVAVMAFYPIFASPANAGEYCRTLFSVVAIALLLSWLISMMLTPVQCIDMLADPAAGEAVADPYAGKFYQRFREILASAIRTRWRTVGILGALLVASILAFGSVRQMFFPDSMRAQFMIDFWAPEGTRVQEVASQLEKLEAKLLTMPAVKNVSAFIGAGPPRFYLPVDPEGPNGSYAQLIVNTQSYKDVDPIIQDLEPWVNANYAQVLFRVRKYGVGPADTWKVEARFSGPAEADFDVLRALAGQGMRILEASPLAKEVRNDMRQRVAKIVPDYAQERARWAQVTRADIAAATRRAYDGLQVGLYREGDNLYPILLRHIERERQDAAELQTLQVQPTLSRDTVPLSQVTRSIAAEWEDPIVVRYNRRRAISVQATPKNATFPALYATVVDDFKAIELPPLYELMWDGESKSTAEAQEGLVPGIIPAVVIILFIIVALFNAFRPPLIILITIPFVIIGITAGLLVTRAAFGFVALLGAMSLSGMMIKNAIVLLDQIGADIADGKSRYQAVIDSAVSRLRPVVLAAATTVLGVVPLLQDLFWVSMSVTIMAGLTFGTVLTMVLVPVLYATLYRVPSPQSLTGGDSSG
jgi:multidrug efflux pump subunit AcrB